MPAISEQKKPTLSLRPGPVMTIQELHASAMRSKSRAEELTVTLSNLMDQEYTLDDAKRNRNIVEYAQGVIKYARSAEFVSELHQLLWVWGSLDSGLRTDLDSPTSQTTTLRFMENLQKWQTRWYRRYKYNMKPVNCRDCEVTWSSRARKVKGKTFCNPCGLAKGRKNKRPKKLNTTTDASPNESDSLPRSDPRPRPNSSPCLVATDPSLQLDARSRVAENEDSLLQQDATMTIVPESENPSLQPKIRHCGSSLQQNAAAIVQDETTYQEELGIDLVLLSTNKAFQWGSSSGQDAAAMVLDEMTETTCQQYSDLDPQGLSLLDSSLPRQQDSDLDFQWGSSSQQDVAAVLNEMTEITEITETNIDLLLLSTNKAFQWGPSSQQDAAAMVLDEMTKTTETTCQQGSDLDPDLLPPSTDEPLGWRSSFQQNSTTIVQDETTETTYREDSGIDLVLLSTDKAFNWSSFLQDETICQRDLNFDL